MGPLTKQSVGEIIGAMRLGLDLLHHQHKTSPIVLGMRMLNVEPHHGQEGDPVDLGMTHLIPPEMLRVETPAKAKIPSKLTPHSSRSSTRDSVEATRNGVSEEAIQGVSSSFGRTLW